MVTSLLEECLLRNEWWIYFRMQGGQLVIYGCLSGKSPVWPWQSWVFRGLQVQGFNFRSWMAKNAGKVGGMMEALGGLMKADQLRITVTEYGPPPPSHKHQDTLHFGVL